MRFIRYENAQGEGLAVATGDGVYVGLGSADAGFPGDLSDLIAGGDKALRGAAEALAQGVPVDLESSRLLPPIAVPGKIICVGLNYADHSEESGYAVPTYPAIFARFPSSLIGDGAPIIRPQVSECLDFEGELVAVIGKRGRRIAADAALDHVVGYSLFNDASIRDFQHRTPQWTVGKNFDDTGAFGPEFVTADELPAGCAGLAIETRLNGEVVQSANTDDLVFDVATLVSLLSEAFTLEPGDIIVTGTPSGVGAARKPPLWMKAGDICEVTVESVGTLRNPIVDER